MAFETLEPPPKGAKASEPVRVGVTARGTTSPAKLCLLVKRELIDKIAKGATLATVELGTAEDRHLVRIRPNGKGEFVLSPTPRGGPLRMVLPPNKRWPACVIRPQGASYEIGKGYIDVTLPAWAWDAGEKAKAEARAR